LAQVGRDGKVWLGTPKKVLDLVKTSRYSGGNMKGHPMKGDTEIEVEAFTFDQLPCLEWGLSRECDTDPTRTTTVEIQSGDCAPHTTIRFCPAKADADVYHVLWWCYSGGGEIFRAFTILKGESTGYGLLVRILNVIDNYKEGE